MSKQPETFFIASGVAAGTAMKEIQLSHAGTTRTLHAEITVIGMQLLEGIREEIKSTEPTMAALNMLLDSVIKEVRAQKEIGNHLIFTSLIQEIGALSREITDHQRDVTVRVPCYVRGLPWRMKQIRTSAVRVAALALTLATIGDETYNLHARDFAEVQ